MTDISKNTKLQQSCITTVISSLFGVFLLFRFFKILYLMYLKLDYKTCAEMPHVRYCKHLYIQEYKLKNYL